MSLLHILRCYKDLISASASTGINIYAHETLDYELIVHKYESMCGLTSGTTADQLLLFRYCLI